MKVQIYQLQIFEISERLFLMILVNELIWLRPDFCTSIKPGHLKETDYKKDWSVEGNRGQDFIIFISLYGTKSGHKHQGVSLIGVLLQKL